LEEKAPAQVIGGPRWVVQAELRVAAAAVARDRVDLLEMTVRVADGQDGAEEVDAEILRPACTANE